MNMRRESRAEDSHRREKRRKVSIQHCLRGRRVQAVAAGIVTKPLIVEHEECLVATVVEHRNIDRARDDRAEIILRIDRPLRPLQIIEPAIRIQGFVSEKVIYRSMQLIRARLGHQVDKAAARPSVLRIKGIRHYLEFLHRFDADSIVHLQIRRRQFNRRAVDKDVCARLLAPVELEATLLRRGIRIGTEKPGVNCTNCSGFRTVPLNCSGRSSISSLGTVVPISDDSDCNCDASLVTVTLSEAEPTRSWGFTVAVLPTETVMPFCVYDSNPGEVTARV